MEPQGEAPPTPGGVPSGAVATECRANESPPELLLSEKKTIEFGLVRGQPQAYTSPKRDLVQQDAQTNV